MKNTLLLIVFLLVSFLVTAQKYDYNWVFGYGSNKEVDGLRLNFNEVPLQPKWIYKGMSMSVTTNTMSDSKGKLLFYTNGCKVFTVDNQLMENGDEIGLGDGYDSFCRGVDPAYRWAQYMIILPFDSNDSLFYLIQQRDFDYFDKQGDNHTCVDALLYSVIDMRKNKGKGSLIKKNIVFYESDTLELSGLTAVKQNEKDWWIIAMNIKNEKLIFHFHDGQINLVRKQKIGFESFSTYPNQTVFSPQGDKYAIYDYKKGLRIFDFDRTTGVLSNFVHISRENDKFAWGGCAFSPNGKLIYVSRHYECFQYNLEADDIAESMKLVGQWDGYLTEERYGTPFGQMQLAPDCRIYISVSGGLENWHIIHNPNEIGLACNLETHIPLPWLNGGAVGNFPNYRLGSDPVCDSTLIGISGFLPPDLPNRRINVSVTPKDWKISVYLPEREKGSWILKDLYGHILQEKSILGVGAFFNEDVDLSSYPKGIYFWEYYSEAGKLLTGRLWKE